MGARYAEMRAAATAVEEAGFDGLWTWDHLRDPAGSPVGVPEVWTTLAALAEVTRRITLGPLVLNVNTRHPGILANMAATLQQVSGGRLLLGLGAGGNRRTPYPVEQEALGLAVEPDAVRAARVAEAIEVMRRLWRGDGASFDGTHYRLVDPPPPVVVGGFGPRMAGIAGRVADGFNTQAGHPDLAGLVGVAREARAAAGRGAEPFSVSVFAGARDPWLRRDSPQRATLERLGVDRLILLLEPPYDPTRIRVAARALAP